MGAAEDIFRFIHPGEFLRHWRKEQKKKNPVISHGFICQRLGVKSRSYFSDLESGRRMLGTEMMDRLLRLLNLNREQTDYFRAMVGFSQAATVSEKDYWFEQLIALNHTPHRICDPELYEYFANSSHAVVRALIDIYPTQKKLESAAGLLEPPLSAKQLRQSLSLLEALGLIECSTQGEYSSTDKVLSVDSQVSSELLAKYQRTLVQDLEQILSSSVSGKSGSASKTISNTIVLSLSSAGLQHLKKRMERIRKEVLSIAYKDEQPAEHVYQFHIHLVGKTKDSLN